MKNRLLILIATMVALFGINAPALAQQVPDAIISNDGIGFSRMADDILVAYDLVAAYDEHAILDANCSAFKSDVQGVSWCFSNAANKTIFEAAT